MTETNPQWKLGFESLESEIRVPTELKVEGKIPLDLKGSLFRNGPARFDVYGDRYLNWFDGDGMIYRFALKDGRVFYQHRFVETKKKKAEDEAGRRIFGEFGTRVPGGFISRFLNRGMHGNPANTNVVYQGDRLYALCEGGLAYRLDPSTLETLGEDNFNGVLADEDHFSAHPHRVASSGQAWNFGLEYGKESFLHVYRWNQDNSLERCHRLTIPFVTMVHDFAVTETHAVFILPPLMLPKIPIGLMTGQKTFGDSLRWRPEQGTTVAVLNLATQQIRWHRTEARMVFHMINAVSHGDDVIVDYCAYADDSPMRSTFDLMKGKLSFSQPAIPERLELKHSGETKRYSLANIGIEFPRTSRSGMGEECDVLFGVAWSSGEYFARIPTKINLKSGAVEQAAFAPDEFAHESVPVRKSGSSGDSDVWLLTPVLNGGKNRSELRVYDGNDLKAPPVGVVPLPYHIPFSFHGSWVPRTF